jgi:hypothetical protein
VATWQFIGVTVVTDVATNNITLTEPTGVQQGDLLVGCIAFRSAAATGFTLPAGWTLVDEVVTNNTTANSTAGVGSAHMAYIIRGSSAPDLTWTRSSGANAALGRVIAYRNAAQTSTKDTNNNATTATNTTAISVAGVTTSQANDLLVAMIGAGRNSTMSAFNSTTPGTSSGATSSDLDNPLTTTWKERADSGTATGGDTDLAIYDAVKATAGATGNLTATALNGAGHAVVVGAFKIVDDSAQTSPTTVTGYQISNTASDLTGVGQNKALVTSGATAGSWSGQSLGSASLVHGSFFTPSGDPGANGIASKFITVRLNVTSGNANLRYSAQAVRVNSSGTVQALGPSSDETASGVSAVYTLQVPTTGLGTWASGDRLELRIRIQNRTTNSTQSTTITYASYASSVHAGWSNATSKWNYGDKADEVTLSGSDLTATRTAATVGTGYNNVRATVLNGSNKVYGELMGAIPSGANANAVGVANFSAPIQGTGNYLGSDNNGIGYYADGTVYRNATLITTIATWNGTDWIAVAVDRTNNKIWFKNLTAGSGWNNAAIGSQDPANNVGGLDISAISGSLYPFTSFFDINDARTVSLGGSPYTGSLPSGFTHWDGSVPVIPNKLLLITSQARTRAAFW